MLRAVEEVSTRPPASKSTFHEPSAETRAVSPPDVNVATDPSVTTFTSADERATANAGVGSTPPVWCSIRTPITSSIGEVNVTVTRGRLSVSPREVSGTVAL